MNKTLYKSKIGTPVYSDLNIQGDTYTKEGVNYSFTNINQPEAIFSVTNQRNNLVVTEIIGSPSPIFEYIGTEAWHIECEMTINGANLEYPSEIPNILTALNSNQVLHVKSWYLNMLGIFDIVIAEKEFRQAPGELNNQVIRFEAWSIQPLLLLGNTGNSAGNTPNGANVA